MYTPAVSSKAALNSIAINLNNKGIHAGIVAIKFHNAAVNSKMSLKNCFMFLAPILLS